MKNNKKSLLYWKNYKNNLLKSTFVPKENIAEREERINRLLKKGNHEEFFKYYFPKYSSAEAADFHKKSSKKLIENPKLYIVRAWCRGLSKSTRTMMEIIYLALTGEVSNILLFSQSETKAQNLLKPYKLNFEFNQRIINDFGIQKGIEWTDSCFITKKGISFSAFGAGQDPRGSKKEEIRPDVLIFDDIDTDIEVRNSKRIENKWNWIEQAVLPTTDIAKNMRIIFCGNIIGKFTCITLAMQYADVKEIINIRDKNGKSTWIEKNSEQQIDYMLSKMSFRSGQKEYFNNPIQKGTVFEDMVWDKVPPLDKFKYLICYGDPATSDRKRNLANKGVFIIGYYDNKYYVINGFLDNTTNEKFVQWYFDLNNFIGDKSQIINYIENNTLQNPFYEQVFLPIFHKKAIEQNMHFNIRPDERKKPDKFSRIEGNLEPLNRQGRLIFNEKEKSNPNFKRLEQQFLDFNDSLDSPADGPDAVEGGIFLINERNNSGKHFEVKTKNHSKRRF